MLKKTITFVDFNGNKTTEDHYFHLSKADLIELEMSYKGGLSAMLTRIIEDENGPAIISEFKKLLLMSYGKKSPDGKRFVKTEELRQDFMSSEAYSTLFMELCTDAEAASAFVNGIVPANIASDISKVGATSTTEQNMTDLPLEPVIATPDKKRVLTKAEVTAMDSDELKHLLATGQAIIG